MLRIRYTIEWLALEDVVELFLNYAAARISQQGI